jgi:hypothetical protein
MKTRIIATAILTYIAFSSLPLMANMSKQSVSGLSNSENPVSVPVQSTTEIQTMDVTALLDDWHSDRALWEQTGENSTTESILVSASILEEWVTGLESWEQEREITINQPALSGSVCLDQWITGIEVWEQE